MAISVSPRDIKFKLSDSCNYCCMPKEIRNPDLYQPVYVTTKGKVEIFSKRKANGRHDIAIERALGHLMQSMEQKVATFNGEPSEVLFRSNFVLLDVKKLGELRYYHLEDINDVLVSYLIEKLRGTGSVKPVL